MAITTGEYTLLAVDPVTGTRRAELPYSELSFSWSLNAPGSISFVLPMRAMVATTGVVYPGATEVQVYRNGYLVWAGLVWGVRGQVRGEREVLEFTGQDLMSAWMGGSGNSGRFIRHDLDLYGDQTSVVTRSLIQYLQGRGPYVGYHGGRADLGIVATCPESGVEREAAFVAEEWVQAAQAISDMADQDDGFDFGLTFSGSMTEPERVFRTWFPRRGEDRSDYPLSDDAVPSGIDFTIDATRSARRFRASGGGGGAATEEAQVSLADDDTVYREWTVDVSTLVLDAQSVTEEELLQAHVGAAAKMFQRPVVLPTLEILNGSSGLQWVNNVLPGDYVPVSVDSGYFRMEGTYRVIEVEVKLDTVSGWEKVSLKFNEDYEVDLGPAIESES